MSALQTGACAKQRFPAVNLLRQVMKANGLNLVPKSKSNGYEIDGSKRLHRWYQIE